MFGGDTGIDRDSDDFYQYSLTFASWTDLRIPSYSGGSPSKRRGHAMASSRGSVFVFGGKNSEDFKYLNDLHEYRTQAKTWADLSTASLAPTRRWHHAMTAWNGTLYVFGGSNDVDYYNDLQAYNVESRKWIELRAHDSAIQPKPRNGHGFAAVGGALFIHAGFDTSQDTGDLHKYDLRTGKWTDLTSSNRAAMPEAR
eukprot:69944-Rhodomonas_salina.1